MNRGISFSCSCFLAVCVSFGPSQAEQVNENDEVLTLVKGIPWINEVHFEALEKLFFPIRVPPIETDRSIDAIITEYCGIAVKSDVRSYMRKRIVQLNNFLPETALVNSGRRISIPFCAPVYRKFEVTVQKGDTISGLLDKHYGLSGEDSQKEFYLENADGVCAGYRDAVSCSRFLPIGRTVTIPYKSGEASGVLRPNISKVKYEQVYDLAKGNVEGVSIASNDNLSIVQYSLHENDSSACNNNISGELWPLPIREISKSYTYANHLAGLSATNGTILVIDTGPSFGVFDKNLFWKNPGEANHLDKDENGYRGDVSGIGRGDIRGIWGGDFWAIPPDIINKQRHHGTRVASAALGGTILHKNATLDESKFPRIRLGFGRISTVSTQNSLMLHRDAIKEIVKWQKKFGFHVANVSFGQFGQGSLEVETDDYRPAMDNKETLFVAAAGNEELDLDKATDLSRELVYPAILGGNSDKPFITVGAHDQHGMRLKGTAFGSKVDLLAPGCAVLTDIPSDQIRSPDQIMSAGTSFAAPLVSYAAASLKSVGLAGRALTLRNRLIISTDFKPGIEAAKASWSSGLLNVSKSLLFKKDLLEVNTEDGSFYVAGDFVHENPLQGFCASPTDNAKYQDDIIKKASFYSDESGKKMARYIWGVSGNRLDSGLCEQSSDYSIIFDVDIIIPRDTNKNKNAALKIDETAIQAGTKIEIDIKYIMDAIPRSDL